MYARQLCVYVNYCVCVYEEMSDALRVLVYSIGVIASVILKKEKWKTKT